MTKWAHVDLRQCFTLLLDMVAHVEKRLYALSFLIGFVASLEPMAGAEAEEAEVVQNVTFSTPNRHVPILSLLDQKVMQKVLRFTLLFDMGSFGHFWTKK